jgi:hypothetical protein
MLQSTRRHILYFDFALSPYPSDAQPIPLRDLLPSLEERANKGEAVQFIDNERRVIRLSHLKRGKSASGKDAVAMLFCLGDQDKADPGFTNFQSGKIRIPEKEDGEIGGLSVHAIVELDPTTPGGHIYRMLYEDVTGFGRTLMQNFLRGEFRIIADELGITFKREGKRELKTRPLVEMTGHASDTLKESLKEGRLLHVELISYVEQDFGFDEARYIKSARQDMSLSIGKGLPSGEALSIVEKLKVWAKSAGYETMRVRWRDPNMQKPQSASVDTARKDAGEAVFVRSAEVRLNQPLPDICDSMSDELVSKMLSLLD